MFHQKSFILCIILILLAIQLQAQQDSVVTAPPENPMQVSASDSAKVVKHSPTTAMLLSIIPGGGQIYNHKYWKLPIVYGLLGASGYFVYYTAHNMVTYRNEFINRRDGNLELIDPKLAKYPDENLLELKNKSQRNMEIGIAITAVLYALNIVDAMVDAHLYYFDISDDLSLRWSPAMVPNLASGRNSFGLTLQFNW